jgi:protein MpaA
MSDTSYEIASNLILPAELGGFRGRWLHSSNSSKRLLLLERKAVNEHAPTLYLSAGIHGNEPAGVQAIVEHLLQRHFSPHIHWLIFPCLNPTGYTAQTRHNDQGIDLNRDYLLQRSEEVRLHAQWFREECPCIDLYLSLHEDWEARGCYLYEINTHPQQQGFATEILAAAANIIPLDPGPIIDNHLLDAPGLIYHEPEPDEAEGWPEAIYTCKHRPLLSYTFETPSPFPIEPRILAHRRVIDVCAEKLLAYSAR